MWVKKIAIRHKRNECIGCWSCVLLAPHQWKMDENDGKATLCNSEWKGKQFMVAYVDEDEIAENKEAEIACPVRVIQVSD